MTETEAAIERAHLAQLPGPTVHAIMRLRQDVFVVEQECAYPDLDGRDVEATTELWWAHGGDPADVLATLRVMTEPDGSTRIGRVAARIDMRGTGLAHRIVGEAVASCAGRIVLDAQSPLAGWYERHGFHVVGDEFLEDGIPHVPMTRPAP